QLEDVNVAADVTRTSFRFLTPAYASPEQIRGDRVGIQSDVYSLGVILYELLCDQLPFDFSNKTPAEAQAAILENEPVKPSFLGQRTASEKASNSPGGPGSTTKA